jgi:hypothetical protein
VLCLFFSRPYGSAFDQTLDADQDRVGGGLGFSNRWGGLFFSLVLTGPHSTILSILTKVGSVGVSGFPTVGGGLYDREHPNSPLIPVGEVFVQLSSCRHERTEV